jgi:hypothetical protein
MIKNYKYIRILKEEVVAYLKELSQICLERLKKTKQKNHQLRVGDDPTEK